ncbi:MAG: immunoglobulin domain-containing protein, partial [Limisphaerales bacterium]
VFAAVAQPDYPSAHWVSPVGCTKYYTSGNGHQFCVIHDSEGYYEYTISYLNNCSVNASIYYLVNGLQNGNDTNGHLENTNDAVQGDITQEVRESDYAWHALCWNTWMFGTEHEGFVSNPCWYTEGMYLASANLQRYLCDQYGIPKDRNHIIGHNEWQNPTWTSWMGANYPAINATCNNHTDPGVYWDWNHFMALITGGPAISSQPYSQLVDAGSNGVFTATVQGSNTLYFQWSKNGVPITGATNSSLTICNAQAVDAGSYSLFASNSIGTTTSRTATLNVSPAWAPSFSDDFETNSSARWSVFGSGFITWGFDYSTNLYVANGITNFIPPAPSGNSSHGLKMTCNKNTTNGTVAGLSLYPKGLFLTGDYILRFDAWINYAGATGGTNGSTEFASCGLNHVGNKLNWVYGFGGDGIYFTWDGDGGTRNRDYRAYQGTNIAPTFLSFTNSGIGASGATRDHYSDPFFQSLFPSPTYETQGACGKHWVQVELAYINNNIYWQINGQLVAQRTNTSSFTNGDVMVGYMDPQPDFSAVPADNYGIFDNVRVYVAATAPVVTFQPTNVTVAAGTDATFTVYAGGSAPLSYQWEFNGTNIDDATDSTYTRLGAQSVDVGSYSVVITNSAGITTSSNAVLVLGTPASITSQPQSQTVNVGTNATFSVTAAGTTPFTFQWQRNGQNTMGATGAALVLSNVPFAIGGTYTCTVTNQYGGMVSQPAVLTVVGSAPQFGDSGTLQWTPTGFGFPLYGLSGGGDVVIYASPDCMQWQPIYTNPPLVGTLQFSDPAATNFPVRFYKAVEQ